ncbi:hypothetical protein CONLIGDRAFT_649996 [Coniochaeta ligniaria NRRL 30616]|uniref:Uncharacterized protein n=1 Tax=Coniochaeta ligniaria NRRL 30616 TaxID=1408157 RepID=A0A1J7I6D3_9PEZI|nr:hypothetical protein CONLIGDRAFT_649996 [Coniochaeta ligniaria NRRL 30616]
MPRASSVPARGRIAGLIRVLRSQYRPRCKGASWEDVKTTFGPHLVANSDIVIGRVLGIHVKREYITGDGLFDVLKAAPIARESEWISSVHTCQPRVGYEDADDAR